MSANDTITKRMPADDPTPPSKKRKSSACVSTKCSRSKWDVTSNDNFDNTESLGFPEMKRDRRERALYSDSISNPEGNIRRDTVDTARDGEHPTRRALSEILSDDNGLATDDESMGNPDPDPDCLEFQPASTIVKNPGPQTDQVPDSPVDPFEMKAWINIFLPNDLNKENGPWEIVSLDTQADTSVIFKKKLVELGLEDTCYYSRGLGDVKGISCHKIKIIGDVTIRFMFDQRPDKVYEVRLDVLEDDPDDTKSPPFNILIGKPTLNKYELVTVDRTKIPNLLLVRKTHKL